jgi:hypothetical protein
MSHQVEGHVKTRQQRTCAQFCAIQGAQEAKRACLAVASAGGQKGVFGGPAHFLPKTDGF